MRNNHWSKTLTALLLAMLLLAGSVLGALAEEAAVVADLTAEEETEPVLLASVNGDEIWSNNEIVQEVIEYYAYMFTNYYGMDLYSDEETYTDVQAAALQWAITQTLYEQKARELNVEEMTAEQKADLEASAKAEWDEVVTYYAENMGGLTEDSTEDEIAAARVDALAFIEANFGYTEESYVNEIVESGRVQALQENVQKAVLGEFTATDEEIADRFNELVEEDKASYEGNIPMYEYYTQYMGSESYYVPEGYRGITHILLEVDSELLDNYTSLQAALEEQQEEETADVNAGEGTEETAQASTEESAEGTIEVSTEVPTEEPKEPVTQEQVDAAKQAILDSVQAKVDEIRAKYEAGTPFVDLIAEYGTDPGMTVEPNRTDGYAVHEESILWDPAFTEGAMSLKEVGDISEPVLSSFGIHILHYTRDIPAGAVELTEELRAQLAEEIVNEKESAAVSEMVEKWTDEAEIIYTSEGRAILDAAEANTESVETTEATEEVLSDGN